MGEKEEDGGARIFDVAGPDALSSRIFVFGQSRFPLITLLSNIASRWSRDHAMAHFTTVISVRCYSCIGLVLISSFMSLA